MNILIVVPWYNKSGLGGVRIAIEKIASALIKSGHQITILIQGDSDTIEFERDSNGIPVYSFTTRSPYLSNRSVKSVIAFIFYLIPTLLKIRKFLKQHKIDVTTIFYPEFANIHFYLLKLLFSVKYVVSVRGSDIRVEAKEHWLASKGVAALIRHADGLIPCSRDMRRETELLVGRIPRLTEVIYTGIGSDWGNDQNEDIYQLEGDFILTLAWAHPVKGPDVLIRAFSLISEQYPNVKLIMVGSGPEENALVKLIDDLLLQNRIIRLGNIENAKLAPLYKKALFGVVPSRNEGFPKVTLEFGLMKKAVIASRVGGLPEIIKDDFNGYLVPPDDPQSLADRMAFLIERPELCKKFGENGYRLVIDSFTIDKTGEKFQRLLEEVIAN